MTKAYGWRVKVNRKKYFKLRLQNCSLINQNTMTRFFMHTPYIIINYPHQDLSGTMRREGAGMHFIPFFLIWYYWHLKLKNYAVIHDHFRQIILFFSILNVFFLSREIVSMYTHVYCSHVFPLLWYVCCSWYVQYGPILFLTLIT